VDDAYHTKIAMALRDKLSNDGLQAWGRFDTKIMEFVF
jgi:hypothetical protein